MQLLIAHDVDRRGEPQPRRRRNRGAMLLTLAIVGTLLTLVGVSVPGGPAAALSASKPAQVTAGVSHTCALTTSGGVKCWGRNDFGQLGNGGSFQSTVPVDVSGLTSGVIAVSAGGLHTCALTSVGQVKCWGYNDRGQLGNGTTSHSSTPVSVIGLTSGVVAISSGWEHVCAIDSVGAVKCWGFGGNGRLGTNGTANSSVPVNVVGLSSGATAVGLGNAHSCAVVSGAARCWGLNDDGQLGDSTTASSSVPVRVTGLGTGVADLAGGTWFSCALSTSGAVSCWGRGSSGELGNGSTSGSSAPVAVTGLSTGVTSLASGLSHSCAVTPSGAVRCWGLNNHGQLGNGSSSTISSTPVNVSGVSSGARAVAGGESYSCALTNARAVECWGLNSNGQLGNSSTTQSSVPVQVAGGQTFGLNSPPSAVGQSVTAPRGVATHVVLGATDGDVDDVLAYTVVDQPSKGELVCAGAFGEDCTYTAGPGQTGSDSFTFKANDGTVDSSVATVSITITNQKPVADAISAAAPRGVASEVVLTGADPNGDPLTFTKLTEPSKGTTTCTTVGVCTYTANAGTSGTDTFTYTTSDGALTSTAATVTIQITNQAPTADARSLDAGRGVATPVTLSGSDPNSDQLTFAVIDQPGKGTLTCGPVDTSDCTYTSTVTATGTDSFTYIADDSNLTSEPVEVTITLANAGPTANDQSVDAPRGVATPITLSGADAEGDATTFTIVDKPTKGVLTCTGATGADCTYAADAGTTGTDSFTFTAGDGADESAQATVTITITNQAPTANAQTLAANAPTNATPITLTGSDPNGDALTYAVTSGPSKGTLSCELDVCTYTANSGATGADSFSFAVTDIDEATSSATVNLRLDSTTPGVFIGRANKMEPESGSSARGTVLPVTLSQPSPVPLTVWYYTTAGTATEADYMRFGTQASPRSVTIPAGATWTTISVPVRDDALVEGDETFSVHLVAATGGAVYMTPTVTEVTIRDADSIERGDPATPLLSVTSVRQAEGNAATPTARKAQVRVELSKAATSTLTVKWATVPGTANAGTDFVAKTGTLTFAPGNLEKSIDVSVFANNIKQQDRNFSIVLTSITGATVHLVNADGVITIADDD